MAGLKNYYLLCNVHKIWISKHKNASLSLFSNHLKLARGRDDSRSSLDLMQLKSDTRVH